jgi:hypothetical protein
VVCFLGKTGKFEIMKALNLITAIVAATAFFSSVSAQSSAAEIDKEFYKADMNLSIVISTLPAAYTFAEQNGSFYIRRPDSVWIIKEDRLSAPRENREQKKQRAMAKGLKSAAMIVFRYEKRWDAAKVEAMTIQNAAYQDEINRLPEKHKITHLLDKSKSGKGAAPVYKAKTDADKKAIERYEAEKAKLEKNIVKLPDYHTQHYSLFLQLVQGINDDNHLVYPEEASQELYTILATFREVCGK